MKFHPFLRPFTETHSLLLMLNNSLLTLSNGLHNRLRAEMHPYTLIGCQKPTSLYLCERKGILHRSFDTICLGTLYDQNIDAVLELCPLTIVLQKEVILQIQASQYLVYLPKPVTGNIECLNQSNTKLFLPKGVSQINVSPTCSTVLPKHVIISDLSNKPETNLKWPPEQDFIPDASLTKINAAINFLSKENAG
jgi:hypothetical protein